MEITYMGDSSFLIKGGRTVAVNPTRRIGEGAIELHTRRQKAGRLIVNGPGEYEIGGVLIATAEIDGTLVHAIELDDMNVLHLAGGATRPDQRARTAIGAVDILIVNADDLEAARTVINDLAPRTVLPFGRHAGEVCTTVGVKNAEPQASFSWNGSSAPAKAVLLKVVGSKSRAA